MSQPQPNQREKASEVIQVRLTPTERERVAQMANAEMNGNLSGWARRELMRSKSFSSQTSKSST